MAILAVILARHPEGVLLVHGTSPRGADANAAVYAAHTPATGSKRTRRTGAATGHLRKATMIGLGADGCAAFLRGASPGTTAIIRLARAAGIPVWLRARAAGAEPSSSG
jgi:hypothetical protein